MIEDTIRRNASPIRLEPSQEDDCSLASSTSDEPTTPRNTHNRNSIGAMMQQQAIMSPMYVPNQMIHNAPLVSSTPITKYRHSTGQQLLHSYSTNDASLGEYKYTVNVGQHSIKITGDSLELVRVAKLVLDDYFSSSEFLASIETEDALNNARMEHPGIHTAYGMKNSHLNPMVTPVIPKTMYAIGTSTSVDRIDSGIALDKISKTPSGQNIKNDMDAVDDDVFIVDDNGQEIPVGSLGNNSSSFSSTNASASTVKYNSNLSATGLLSRSKRSNFSNSSRQSISPSSSDGTKDESKTIHKELNNKSK